MHFFHPLDGSKIKGLRGCKNEMLSKESGRCPVRIQMDCFIGSLSGLANVFALAPCGCHLIMQIDYCECFLFTTSQPFSF